MTQTVSIGYFWTMFALAFVVGLMVQRYIMRSERRMAQAQLKAAADLLCEVAAIARTGVGGRLPARLHRRICQFRDGVGA